MAATIFLVVVMAVTFSGAMAWVHYKTTPPYVDPDIYKISGIDVSRHQGMMNLQATAAEGYNFIFIKASEGESLKDSNFRLNYEKASKAGLKTGAYHYFRFDKDGIAQGKNLLEQIKGCPLDLGVAIDVEEYGNASDVDKDVIEQRLISMIEYLNLCGLRPIIYTNIQGYDKYISKMIPGCVLWICSFTIPPPDLEWTFWQFNHRGNVAGIRGDVDVNVFHGDSAEWEEFLKAQRCEI